MKMYKLSKPVWPGLFICLFLVSVTGCPITEPSSTARATIINNSSYDLRLRLTFEEEDSFIRHTDGHK
jgi:hypothetical protein